MASCVNIGCVSAVSVTKLARDTRRQASLAIPVIKLDEHAGFFSFLHAGHCNVPALDYLPSCKISMQMKQVMLSTEMVTAFTCPLPNSNAKGSDFLRDVSNTAPVCRKVPV